MADSPKNVAAPQATAEEVQTLRRAQQDEYGTYVALAVINFNGTVAYLPGEAVPVSNVERHGYEKQGLVAKVDSAEAKRLITSIHEASLASAAALPQEEQVSLGVPVPGTK